MECLKYTAKTLPQITLTGKVYVQAPNCHFQRKPVEYILYFVTKGFMTILEDNQTYNIKKGDVLILDPSHTHKGLPHNSEVEYFYIHFTSPDCSVINASDEDISDYVLQNKMDTSSQDTLIIPKLMNVESSYELFLNLVVLIVSDFSGKSDFYKTKTSLNLMELFTKLSIGYSENARLFHKNNELIINLINYIHENCHTNITSQELEKHFNLNFDYLNRLFKATTNTTIINYTNRYRISESKKLLTSGIYNVKQTAQIMGFSNEFYFSRVYKKFEGISPSSLT